MDNREFGELVTSASILHLGRRLNSHSNGGVEEEINDNISNFLFLSEELLIGPVRFLLENEPEHVWNLIKNKRNVILKEITMNQIKVQGNTSWYEDYFYKNGTIPMNNFFNWYQESSPKLSASLFGCWMANGSISSDQFTLFIQNFGSKEVNSNYLEILMKIVDGYITTSLRKDFVKNDKKIKLFHQLVEHDSRNIMNVLEKIEKMTTEEHKLYLAEVKNLKNIFEIKINSMTHHSMFL